MAFYFVLLFAHTRVEGARFSTQVPTNWKPPPQTPMEGPPPLSRRAKLLQQQETQTPRSNPNLSSACSQKSTGSRVFWSGLCGGNGNPESPNSSRRQEEEPPAAMRTILPFSTEPLTAEQAYRTMMPWENPRTPELTDSQLYGQAALHLAKAHGFLFRALELKKSAAFHLRARETALRKLNYDEEDLVDDPVSLSELLDPTVPPEKTLFGLWSITTPEENSKKTGRRIPSKIGSFTSDADMMKLMENHQAKEEEERRIREKKLAEDASMGGKAPSCFARTPFGQCFSSQGE